MKQKIITILILLVMLIGCLGLIMSYAATVAYADDGGYPAPIDTGYPEPGYPVEVGYPATGYPEPLPGYPIIDPGYPVFEPMPLPDYPEPIASSPEIELSSNPLQLDPIMPQYRNGRNLWQEICYQFGKLLERMK